jgi:hypothetical protein
VLTKIVADHFHSRAQTLTFLGRFETALGYVAQKYFLSFPELLQLLFP